MIDHMGIKVGSFERAVPFYEQVLAPLGYAKLMSIPIPETGMPAAVGFGAAKPDFWLTEGEPPSTPFHVAFAAASAAAVDAFHAAALDAGGRCNGKPGPRPQYHGGYYGAFVLDPDGYNIEAVFHGFVPVD